MLISVVSQRNSLGNSEKTTVVNYKNERKRGAWRIKELDVWLVYVNYELFIDLLGKY